jgi:hypothetical protein
MSMTLENTTRVALLVADQNRYGKEALVRIGNMMAALDPHDLTFEECRDMFKLLRSFMDARV